MTQQLETNLSPGGPPFCLERWARGPGTISVVGAVAPFLPCISGSTQKHTPSKLHTHERYGLFPLLALALSLISLRTPGAQNSTAQYEDPGSVYHGLVRPDNVRCCGTTDCAPVQSRYGKGLEILWKGKWLEVPESSILPQLSWDENYHACVPRSSTTPICVIVPGSV